ncbi:ornithine carbamoyltransferase [Candidatus Galacturonibacter soehngenii]|uniref:Peptide transporter n=1 Tax=Candidatus Galacturonatibacter soehngenii TaxID=2307010 RepID=A0A7V7QM64_9FIRM|nr:peptide transporter [Candidatus Galacturonibacter soehngenii]KAB1439737.1 peptide transporter [Candidatus Galacturonibacter soehngenii]
MKHSFLRLTDYSKNEFKEIFQIADELKKQNHKYKNALLGKTIVMFFPESSIRTRITFEKGIYLLGGQTILFPPETLRKKEDLKDVIGYLNNWADAVIVRDKDIKVLEELDAYANIPIINAMTNDNHPCEILSDLYSLSKMRANYQDDHFLFVGQKGNIGLAWKEGADAMGLILKQSCPKGYEIPGVEVIYDIKTAMKESDIVCTDSLPNSNLSVFKEYQITRTLMDHAMIGAVLNPCPPFYRGEEVSEDVINSHYFVGYEFKKHLLEIQQAIILHCLGLNQ